MRALGLSILIVVLVLPVKTWSRNRLGWRVRAILFVTEATLLGALWLEGGDQ